jgi:hypothetical protein
MTITKKLSLIMLSLFGFLTACEENPSEVTIETPMGAFAEAPANTAAKGTAVEAQFLESKKKFPSFLVVDLDGDGLEGIGYQESKALFDTDGDKVKEKTGWLASVEGFVVIDSNLNGQIDDLAEMFFDSTKRGHAKLAEYDSNTDGLISNSDPAWQKIRIWQDLNSNGSVDDGELKGMISWNVRSIDLNVKQFNASATGGIELYKRSQFTFSGEKNTQMFEAQFYTAKDFADYEKIRRNSL